MHASMHVGCGWWLRWGSLSHFSASPSAFCGKLSSPLPSVLVSNAQRSSRRHSSVCLRSVCVGLWVSVCAVRACCVLGLTTLASLTTCSRDTPVALFVVIFCLASLGFFARVHRVSLFSLPNVTCSLSRSIEEVCAQRCLSVSMSACALASFV